MKLNSNASYLYPVRGKTWNYILGKLGFHATAPIHLLQSFQQAAYAFLSQIAGVQLLILWRTQSWKFMLEETSVDHPVQDHFSSQGQLEQVAQGHVQFGFKYVQ